MYANQLITHTTVKSVKESPIVLSYDNNPTENTEFYMSTLKSHGWPSVFIGKGELWKGFITRIHAYTNALNTFDDEQVLVITDARDVLCVRHKNAFLDAFHEYKRDIVVSMELTCGGQFDVSDTYENIQCVPLSRYWKENPQSVMPSRKFVNAGLIAGKVHALKHMYKWICEQGFTDDQKAIGSYMNAFPNRVAADTEAALLHTSTFGVNAGIQSIHVQKHDSPTLAELYGRGAFFLHIPGLTGSGQSVIYDTVRSIVRDLGASGPQLTRPYAWTNEPAWNEKF